MPGATGQPARLQTPVSPTFRVWRARAGWLLILRSPDLKIGLTGGYFRSTRVPRIFWALSVLRKLGITRSINSK
jgi:hypothetical protein